MSKKPNNFSLISPSFPKFALKIDPSIYLHKKMSNFMKKQHYKCIYLWECVSDYADEIRPKNDVSPFDLQDEKNYQYMMPKFL